MTSLIRYQLAAVLHAQRYLGPLLFFIAVLCVFTINDQGPLTGSYVVSAGSLLIVACWLTVTVVNHEDPVRRAMTAVHAGGPDRVLSGETAVALLAGVLLIAVGTVFPILSGDHHWTGADLAAGLLAQGTAVLAGAAVGLLCSRLVVPRPGWSLLAALIVVIALPLAPGLPPVNPMLRLMSRARPPLGPLAADLAIAAVLLLIAVAATRAVARRRA